VASCRSGTLISCSTTPSRHIFTSLLAAHFHLETRSSLRISNTADTSKVLTSTLARPTSLHLALLMVKSTSGIFKSQRNHTRLDLAARNLMKSPRLHGTEKLHTFLPHPATLVTPSYGIFVASAKWSHSHTLVHLGKLVVEDRWVDARA
jgi:hypothetical protein